MPGVFSFGLAFGALFFFIAMAMDALLERLPGGFGSRKPLRFALYFLGAALTGYFAASGLSKVITEVIRQALSHAR